MSCDSGCRSELTANVPETTIAEWKKSSCLQQAYGALTCMIRDRAFRPGELLSEELLANSLKMSRTPVREAIRILQAEGILEARNGQGTFLKNLTLKELKDRYEVRAVLEAAACGPAVFQIRENTITKLRSAHRRLWMRCQKEQRKECIDRLEMERQERVLHELIVENSSNEYLKRLVKRLNLNLYQYDWMLFMTDPALDEGFRRHRKMIEYLEKRDPEGLKRELRIYLSWSLEYLHKHVSYELLLIQ